MTEPKIPLPEVLNQWRSHAEREAQFEDLKQAERERSAEDRHVHRVTVLHGSVYVPFDENFRIAWANMLAGHPFDRGWLKPVYVPDPLMTPAR